MPPTLLPIVPLPQRLVAETLGTAMLLLVVVGSGIWAQRLCGGNDGLALLANSLATAAGLVVLIWTFADVSGAHFNPAVTAMAVARSELSPVVALQYAVAQLVGAAAGVALTHAMFELPLVTISATARGGWGRALGEGVATFGLLVTILGVGRRRADSVAIAVGLFILAGYWFTSSMAFANPAVTLARTLTDSAAGIRPADVPLFLLGQGLGMAAALLLGRWLWPVAVILVDEAV